MRRLDLHTAFASRTGRFPSSGKTRRRRAIRLQSGGDPRGPGEPKAPGGPGTGVVVETQSETRTRHAPRYKVFVHNDSVTPMEFVVYVLVNIFSLQHKPAVNVMFEAHERGLALVGAYSLEQAEFRVDQAHSLARAQGYPLTFTYEAE